MRTTLLALLLATAATAGAQTYFYIDAIQVQPAQPTPADDVSLNLLGGLSSTGAYVVSSSAQVVGNEVVISIVAADPGGFTVIVPHTEVVAVGQLAAGTYTISFVPVNVGDFAPEPEHTFTVTGAGPSCDSVFINSVEWHPFMDDALLVHSYHYLLDTLFDPYLVLLGTGGDTLAQEAAPLPFLDRHVDYWHTLQLEEGVDLSDNIAEGTMQFHCSGFDGAACTFDGPFALCPIGGCIPLLTTLQNLGGGITTGDFAWNIYNGEFELMALGTFTLSDEQQADTGYACLPPGNYTLDVAPLGPPTGGQPFSGVSIGGGIDGPSAPVSWSLPVPLTFTFYGPCFTDPLGLATPEASVLRAWPNPATDHVRVECPAGAKYELRDAMGRSARAGRVDVQGLIHLDGLCGGTYDLLIREGARPLGRQRLVKF
ncbi:MAG: hypothetical protein KA791_08050 [Flavobacteriales bacterium]|nr:hypothetical protein [Flavobacteriales bacterium]